MPPCMPKLDTSLSESVTQRAAEWRAFDAAPAHTTLVPACIGDRGWSAPQLVVLLDALSNGPALRIGTLNALDAGYGLSASRNSEVKFRWLMLAIKSEYVGVFADAVKMLVGQGRMKFTRPLYRQLYKSAAGRELALATFQKHKGIYHSICAKMVAKDLQL
jgi:leukotriene-A4 hydrolase